MAKVAATTNLSPLAVSVGAVAAARSARTAASVLNYVAGRRPHMHLALGRATLAIPLVGTVVIPPSSLAFAGTPYVGVRTRVRIKVDAQNIIVRLRTEVASAGTGVQVDVTIGGATATLSASSANNGARQTATIATSLSGTGWQDMTVTLTRTTGAAASYIRNLVVQDEAITDPTLFPDPAND